MADADDDFSETTPGGITATHSNAERQLFAAPTLKKDFNTYRLDLAPIACWSVGDDRFEFDSSLVKPGLTDELASLQRFLRGRHFPMAIFGHADPVGDDDFNKQLSGRRATAIYALLTRRPDLWESLFSDPFGGDDWGLKSIQEMLGAIPNPDDPSGAPFFAGPPNGIPTQRTMAAVRAFQGSKGLAVDGDAGPNTRAALFPAYMDAICIDDTGQPFQLDPVSDFLGQGADDDGKVDFQGCSEFNPLLRFSQEEEADLSSPGERTRRDQENAPNRRVVAFLFRKGAKVSPDAWPCPRAKEGVDDCKKRFWSDSEARRAPSDERRTYGEHQDTFACRFYQRIAQDSPCEGVLRPTTRTAFHISLSLRSNSGALVIKNQPFRLFLDDGSVFEGTTDEEGHVFRDDVAADDYLLEVGGSRVFVPATPKDTDPRLTRVPGFAPVK